MSEMTLLDAAARFADSHAERIAQRVAAVAFVTALTAAAAQVSIPLAFTPVPFTLQPMIVLLGGAALGSRLGWSSQVLYLALGAAGAPVFAAAGMLPNGAARLLGPTGGYLVSFPIAAFVAGTLAERGFDRTYKTSVLAMAAGLLVIYAGGIAWLTFFTGPALSIRSAITAGVTPFVLADVVKLFAAAGILPAIWRLTGPNINRY